MTSTYGRILAAALAVTTFAPAFGAEVDQREANQQARISNGVKSGQLTPGETARLERKEATIHREIKRDRAANGGTLTKAEKAKVNRQQDRVSHQIYRAKHNSKTM